ncbi:MAG: GNAT family N-acetyltransferase, partial [Tyzzerella sp.]|nr:GNAT family N-acetyltransferase [Tyzzerella sp.]
MILRKLEKQEHIKTRKLWEEVFTEDTPEFLDYYYFIKTLENEIYVIEEDDKIVSMLHLNPYQMRIGNAIFKTHYIVAVATDENYRKRGYMAALLNHTMQVMKDRG